MPSVLITGTSTGIGAACATHLAGRGWTVYAGVRRDEDADRLRAQQAGDVRPVLLDVANRDHMWRVVDEISNDVGEHGLQGLVNNAGVGVGGPVEYLKEDDWRWVFEVNFFAVVALTQAAIPLLRTGRGRIVHIGSIGGAGSPRPARRPYHAVEVRARGVGGVQPPRVRPLGHADPGLARRARRGEDRRSGTRATRPPTRSSARSTRSVGRGTAG